MEVSTVVAEQVDPAYEPTRQEIVDYATWLGMDPQAHRSLLWIAREALKEDLPPDWKLCQTPEKDPFYFNFATAESSWEHPCDDQFKQLFATEKLKLERRESTGGSTPRCDAIDALTSSELLEGCLRRAMQLDLLTDESAAIVRANVADGLLSANYYAEWWTERIAEQNMLAQQNAARVPGQAKQQHDGSENRADTMEAALDRLLESERWKVERFLESDRAASSGVSGFPGTDFRADEATAFDLQAEVESSNVLPSSRKGRTAQFVARRLLSDSEDDGVLDEECGVITSAPVTPASSAGSSSEDVRTSLDWIPGGMWVASGLDAASKMLPTSIPDITPHLSGAVEKLKAAVSPRAAPLAPSVLPLHDTAPPARSGLLS